jgi:hypothetical protein
MTTRASVTRYFALVISLGCVLAFYFWAASPRERLFGHFLGADSYYNLLIKGFRSGHLSLQVEVPAGVLKLKDPYDPRQNAPFGMHDVSYFKGKFYLYFGAAPAVALYWPFAAATGHFLEDRQAVFLFASAEFLFGSFLLLAISRRYFPAIGVLAEVGGILAMGFATMVPVLLRRQEVYEVAVSSASAFFAASLFCFYKSLHSERGLRWIFAASLAYGFAIGSRPTYLFGSVFLLFPALFGHGLIARRVANACAAIVPVGALLAGILAYNYLRFENPFEFGHNFAFSGADETKNTQFSLAFVWFNFRAYLLAPAHLSAYFPFVRVPALGTAPVGYAGVEDPYGIFPNIPFTLLVIAAPLAWKGRPLLRLFSLGVGASALAVAAVIFTFQFAANRYMVDFLPGFVILAVIGFWGLSGLLSGTAGRFARLACWVLIVWSALFNLFAAFRHNEFLRISNPATFRRLVHAFDYPRYAVDRLVGRTYGPLELTVTFPAGKVGKLEPLVVTGSNFLSDYLYVYYNTRDSIRVGFEHTSYGGPVSEIIPMDFGQVHHVLVDMPSLYPPIGDPYFDGLPADVVENFAEHLRIAVDGRVVIDTAQQFYPAFGLSPAVGSTASDQAAFGRLFSGKILGVRTIRKDWRPTPQARLLGPLLIKLEFPSQGGTAHEPLVSSGYAGRGDVLSVAYPDSGHAIFSLDHWGAGGPTSGPVPIKPGTPETLEVSFGSFFPASERPLEIPEAKWTDVASKLTISLDGTKVFEVRTPFYAAPADTIVVGRNAIGASGCVAEFGGRILSVGRGAVK